MHCKNFCKCQNVTPLRETIKKCFCIYSKRNEGRKEGEGEQLED
jgi:hypothetical protein